MKQKEKWAQDFIKKNGPMSEDFIPNGKDNAREDDIEAAAWLAGFEFAKGKIMEKFKGFVPESTFNKLNVCSFVEDVGEAEVKE